MTDAGVSWMLALYDLRVWIAATLMQRARLREILPAYFSESPMIDIVLHNKTYAEARLFVLSVNQVGVAAALVAKIANEVNESGAEVHMRVRDFESACGDVKKIRNVFAHHDEYIMGLGREQRGKIPELSYMIGTNEIGICYASDAPALKIDIDGAATAAAELGNGLERIAFRRASVIHRFEP